MYRLPGTAAAAILPAYYTVIIIKHHGCFPVDTSIVLHPLLCYQPLPPSFTRGAPCFPSRRFRTAVGHGPHYRSHPSQPVWNEKRPWLQGAWIQVSMRGWCERESGRTATPLNVCLDSATQMATIVWLGFNACGKHRSQLCCHMRPSQCKSIFPVSGVDRL